jgi:hypothetical protein
MMGRGRRITHLRVLVRVLVIWLDDSSDYENQGDIGLGLVCSLVHEMGENDMYPNSSAESTYLFSFFIYWDLVFCL